MVSISQDAELDGPERRRGGPVSPLIWQIFVLVIAALIGYFSAYSALNARVAVLETQNINNHADIIEIKADVKTLLQRVGE